LAENAKRKIGIGRGEVQSANEAADFLVGGGGGAPFLRTAGIRFQITTGAEGVKQERGEALEIGGGSGGMFLRFRGGLRIAREFIEAYSYRLAQVHGAMLFAGGDAQEPMAVAEVFVRKAALLRTEKKGDATAGKTLAEEADGLIEAANRVLQLALAYGGGSHNEGTILDGLSNSLELLGFSEQRRGADRRTRLAKGQFIRVYHAKMEKAEVAHGAGGGPNVEGIARGDKHDPQTVGFGVA
jgi:hypothetical protein